MDSKSKKNIEKALSQYQKIFLPQEKIYARGNTLYITEFRVLNLSLLGKIKDEVVIENVLAISTTKFGSLLVETKDGTSVNFGIIDKKEFLDFQRVLLMIQAGEEPEYVKNPWVQEISTGPAEETVVRVAPPNYGNRVASEGFGNYQIKIFSDGYIQISKGLGLFKGNVEKLLQIECEAQITKKTGLGRGIAGIVTLGANQMVPNQRGNLILTVTTDKEVHVLMVDFPTPDYIKSMNKLVAVGKSVINKGATSVVTEVPQVAPSSQTLAQQIKELSELRDSGVISENEFESAKRKLLS